MTYTLVSKKFVYKVLPLYMYLHKTYKYLYVLFKDSLLSVVDVSPPGPVPYDSESTRPL